LSSHAACAANAACRHNPAEAWTIAGKSPAAESETLTNTHSDGITQRQIHSSMHTDAAPTAPRQPMLPVTAAVGNRTTDSLI
jgi:hypothetical protein